MSPAAAPPARSHVQPAVHPRSGFALRFCASFSRSVFGSLRPVPVAGLLCRRRAPAARGAPARLRGPARAHPVILLQLSLEVCAAAAALDSLMRIYICIYIYIYIYISVLWRTRGCACVRVCVGVLWLSPWGAALRHACAGASVAPASADWDDSDEVYRNYPAPPAHTAARRKLLPAPGPTRSWAGHRSTLPHPQVDQCLPALPGKATGKRRSSYPGGSPGLHLCHRLAAVAVRVDGSSLSKY